MITSCDVTILCSINPSFPGLSSCQRQVVYALRTRPPVAIYPKVMLPLDLHVLSLPLAFILSQDQTLRCESYLIIDFLKVLSGDIRLLSNIFKELLFLILPF